MKIDKRKHELGTIQKLIRLDEAWIGDETCFRSPITSSGNAYEKAVRNVCATCTEKAFRHSIRTLAIVESDMGISWPKREDRFQERERECVPIIFDFRLSSHVPQLSSISPRRVAGAALIEKVCRSKGRDRYTAFTTILSIS